MRKKAGSSDCDVGCLGADKPLSSTSRGKSNAANSARSGAMSRRQLKISCKLVSRADPYVFILFSSTTGKVGFWTHSRSNLGSSFHLVNTIDGLSQTAVASLRTNRKPRRGMNATASDCSISKFVEPRQCARVPHVKLLARPQHRRRQQSHRYLRL
jgi:hypothetical protein